MFHKFKVIIKTVFLFYYIFTIIINTHKMFTVEAVKIKTLYRYLPLSSRRAYKFTNIKLTFGVFNVIPHAGY